MTGFVAEVPIIYKAVHWFVLQINALVSAWSRALSWKSWKVIPWGKTSHGKSWNDTKYGMKQSLQMFFKIDIFKNFVNFTRKQLFWGLFLIKLQSWSSTTLLKRDSNTCFFLVKFAKILRTSSFYRTPPVAASGYGKKNSEF